jgi:hypothetical protein
VADTKTICGCRSNILLAEANGDKFLPQQALASEAPVEHGLPTAISLAGYLPDAKSKISISLQTAQVTVLEMLVFPHLEHVEYTCKR